MSCGCWWRFLSSCVQLCRNTILPAERADMCNRTCSVKRSVTQQGHDRSDEEGWSELPGKPIEGVQSRSELQLPPSLPPFACSPCSRGLARTWHIPLLVYSVASVLCSQAPSRCLMLIFLHLCCSQLAQFYLLYTDSLDLAEVMWPADGSPGSPRQPS